MPTRHPNRPETTAPAEEPGSSLAIRERKRQATLANRPWLHSTGPRTALGKQRSAQNSRAKQKGEKSIRQIRAELAPILALMRQMSSAREAIDDLLINQPGQKEPRR